MAPGTVWETLLEKLASECGAGTRGWHQYSKKATPSLRVKRGGRTIVYLLPGENGFTASFAMGAKALVFARENGLGAYLEGARKYAEGTAVRVFVREMADVATIVALAKAKIAG